jgi:hypothetical protein
VDTGDKEQNGDTPDGPESGPPQTLAPVPLAVRVEAMLAAQASADDADEEPEGAETPPTPAVVELLTPAAPAAPAPLSSPSNPDAPASARPVLRAADDGSEQRAGATIFVTDPTVEAARIEWDLRARGYDVIDVPLAMLVGRVAVQRPKLILLDVDAAGALEVAARVRQLPDAAEIGIIYAGGAGLGGAEGAIACFERPIDVDALLRRIEGLAPSGRVAEERAPGSGPTSSRPPPPSLRAPLSSASLATAIGLPPGSTMGAPSSSAEHVERGVRASEPPLSLRDEPPSPSERKASSSMRTPEQRLSPDLERLLREAEQRVLGGPLSRSPDSGLAEDEVLSPDDEVEAVLPAEILASLDEPIDIDVDDDEGGSSETGGGTPHTGAKAGRAAAHTTGTGRDAPAAGGAAGAGGAGGAADEAAQTNPGLARERTGSRRATTASGNTGVGSELVASELDSAAEPHERTRGAETQTGPIARDAPTPPPPRRHPPATPPPDSDDDPQARSEVLVPRHAPEPSRDHAPPLAPQTSRPPAPRPIVELPVPIPAPVYAEPQRAPAPAPAPAPTPNLELPPPRALLEIDDALHALASAVATRVSGVLRLDEPAGIRRIVLADGDVVTAASSVEGETLLAFLEGRGDLPSDVAKRLAPRVPPWGRLAGAALVAYGHVAQNQLWDVLQAHAAWLLTRSIGVARGHVSFELEPPARLRGEPPVFGGTPGPALVVEIVRRAVQPGDALSRLGGLDVRLARGDRRGLVDECGLEEDDEQLVRRAEGATVRELVAARGEEVAPLLHALVALGVLQKLSAVRNLAAPPSAAALEPELVDPVRDAELDDQAFRERIVARRALIDDADYFAILGVPRASTGYEIRRAYVELRRALDPSRVVRPSLADVVDDLQLVLAVVDEAYDVLKDATRRERYRRAITAEAPAQR